MILGLVSVYFALSLQAASPADQPPPCNAHEMLYHDKLKMALLLNCGDVTQDVPAKVWGWDGAKWLVVSADAPSARTLGGAVYDSRRDRVVMYGGFQVHGNDVVWFPETWEWDGKLWKKIEAAPPTVTDRFAMAFDEERGMTVLFGGQAQDQIGKGDTWTWDGRKWDKASSEGPGVEEHQAMTYDSKRKTVEMFGGAHQPEDFWEWDGRTWSKVAGAQPRARSHGSLVYHEKSDQLILYGGIGDHVWLGATVIRENGAWKPYQGTGPSARGLSAMAYDRERGRVILYGGDQTPLGTGGPETPVGDTWEWDGKQWTQRLKGRTGGS